MVVVLDAMGREHQHTSQIGSEYQSCYHFGWHGKRAPVCWSDCKVLEVSVSLVVGLGDMRRKHLYAGQIGSCQKRSPVLSLGWMMWQESNCMLVRLEAVAREPVVREHHSYKNSLRCCRLQVTVP